VVSASGGVVFACAGSALVGCASNAQQSGYVQGPPAVPPGIVAPPPAATQVGQPLPQGWAWPVNAQTVLSGVAALATYRPINLNVLQANRGKKCAPVEVAPNIWITPLCTKLPHMSTSAKVQRRALPTANAATPDSFDLRTYQLDGPIKDQQQAGVCWSFAISTLMDNGLRRAGLSDVLAPLHIIADDEFDLLYDQGTGRPLVLETSWPYDPKKACELDTNPGDVWCESSYGVKENSWQSDPVTTSERSRAEASGVYRILTMHSLASSPGDPNEVANAIAQGQAVYGGFGIDQNVWSASHPGAVIPDWNDDGQGGHAISLVGYRTVGGAKQFLVHNSWGTSWGDGGYAWISENMIRQRMEDAFVISIGTASGQALPPRTIGTPNPPTPNPPTPNPPTPNPPTPNPPTPTPPPVASVFPFPFPFPFPTPIPAPPGTPCPNGQTRDALLGVCAPTCANGSAPIAGICTPAALPAPPSRCPAGQIADVLTAQCGPACPNGAPRAAGFCLP
jgi:C1A family cysteine protease